MATKPEKSIASILIDDANQLQHLFTNARNILDCEQAVKACIPQEFHAYCHIINLRHSIISIACQNASIATQLRYLNHEILANLRQDPQFAHIRSVKVLVNISEYDLKHAASTTLKPKAVSKKLAAFLTEAATECDDEVLRGILQRIASQRSQ